MKEISIKEISIKESIYELVQKYPKMIDIMIELGFAEIAKPGMLNTVGRVMTLEKGSKMKGISMATIRAAFEKAGYCIEEA